jgi:hypothetical protein
MRQIDIAPPRVLQKYSQAPSGDHTGFQST